MRTNLHSIELVQGSKVVATFKNETEYDEYLGSLAVDYYDGDFDIPEKYKVWYCVFMDNVIASLTEDEYCNMKGL